MVIPFLLGFGMIVGARPQQPGSVLGDRLAPIEVNREHVSWPAPESVMNGLHSSDATVRERALAQMGYVDLEIHKSVWSNTSPSKVIGTKVVTPDQIRLTYAALGDSSAQQAVLAIFTAEAQDASLAVVVHTAGGWERIALISCWCKYDMDPDALTSFLQLHPASESGPTTPEHLELVVHISGGGSGFYNQTEGHFRIVHGELREVLSFTSRLRDCNGGTRDEKFPGTVERRWVFPAQPVDGPGLVLVRASGEFSQDQVPAFWSLPNLEIAKLRPVRCTLFKWEPQHFRYVEAKSAQDPCKWHAN